MVESSRPQIFEEPATALRYYDSHAWYQQACQDGRNNGQRIVDTFFPSNPEEFAVRASQVTDEELLAFQKTMNEKWSASDGHAHNFKRSQNGL